MKFMERIKKKPIIGIIGGKGKMGTWFGNFFQSQGLKIIISDVDTKLSNRELAKIADIVIVSVPISKTVKVIKEVRNFVRPNALFCDFTSLKTEPLKAMKKARSGVLGIHPLFGPFIQDLEGQKIVFCKIRNNKWILFLRKLFEKAGAKIIEVKPEEHDKQMALVQALIHFTNISLARTLYSQKIILDESFLTPIFRLQSLILGRILAQDPCLYAEIEIENPYFQKVLADFEKQITDLAKDVLDKNYTDFVKKFKKTSLFLNGFRKIATTKSSEILRIIDKQPIKIKTLKRKINLKKITLGVLGPSGTFSHQGALEIFLSSKLFFYSTIREIFEAVNNQEVNFGLVPAENTLAGIVPETINCLIEFPLKVTGSFNFRIHHCLLGRARNKNKLKVIRTHQQAFSQCSNWLAKNLPRIKFETSESTTSSILATKNESIGFIAPEVTAKIYNLNILAKNIENTQENFTKFYLISPEIESQIQKKLDSCKTLLLLAVYDRVGVLRDILDVFAKKNLNLTALHSIPSRLKSWDYFFFLEVDVFYPSFKIKKALKELEKYCSIIRVIGVS